jgi:(p)ppGpp synthase/HD superfamily hydrolase
LPDSPKEAHITGRDVPAWIPSASFEAAVLYAVRTHALQARKGGPLPYISHLFAVASLVIEDGGCEVEAIAALLHDAGEDQGGEPRMRDIESRFGKTVADIVRECTDTLEIPKPDWKVRKRAYVAHLAGASPEAIRVSIADKVHNARSMAADYAVLREKLWERFTEKDPQAHEDNYRALRTAFHARKASEAMLRKLDAAIDDLFPKSTISR